MPEAFAVFAVFIVAIAAWFAAWMHARNPANYSVRDELARLRERAVWLEERLEVAQRENWSGDMVASLADELDATSRQLADVRSRALER